MVKTELIRKISEETGLTIKTISDILAAEQKIIKDTIVNQKEEVKLVGFMTISPVFKASRQVRNPKTGEKMMSKEHYAVKAKANGKWF